eukprot:185255_1
MVTQYSKLIYSFSNGKWKKELIELPISMSNVGCVLSMDQNNIITFGGFTNGNARIDDIYVLNVKSMIIKKSHLKCPIKGVFFAVINGMSSRNAIVVSGFVR